MALNLAACQQDASSIPAPSPKPKEVHETVLAFGTFVEVTLIGISEADKDIVMKKIEGDLRFFHYAFHPWQSGPTGRINQLLEATGEFTANPAVIPLIDISKTYSTQSQGLFNPAIGRLIKLWGYHDDFPPEGPSPAAEEIKTLIEQKPSLDSVSIRGVRINNTNPAVKLDFGGIAKGYALDEILKHIKEMGVQHAIINTGGDLKAIGQHGETPWSIGIRDPRAEGNLAGLDIKDNEAVFTSGDYERFYIEADKRYHHILDPRTGYPARNATSVTVVHSNATLADAAATALFIAGKDNWLAIAKSMGIEQAMLVDRDGHIYITPALHKRVKFEKPDLKITVVSPP